MVRGPVPMLTRRMGAPIPEHPRGGATAERGPPLHVAHVSTERGYGGGEVQVLLLMQALAGCGVEQTLVAPPESELARRAAERGHRVVPVGLRHAFDVVSAARLARVLRAVDVAHLHTGRASWLGSLAARWARVPRVVTRRTMRRIRRGARSSWTYAAPTVVLAVSDAIASVVQRAGVDASRIRVVPDAVDEARLAGARAREVARAQLGIDAAAFVVLCMGKLAHGKGVDLLVQAAASVPDARFLVAGDGPERARLEALARELGVAARICFLGFRADVGDLLQACDVLVMPSRHEGLGNAAMEAMHVGRPVVAARVGGLAELVRHEQSGLSFSVGDVPALAAQLNRLRASPELAAQLAAGGRARLDDGLRLRSVLAAHLEVYRELAPQARRTR